MFYGSGVALVTPFKDGKIDEKALTQLIEEQITTGTDFLVPCGTTGESPTLSHEEHDWIIEHSVKIAQGRIKVLAGAGSNSTAEAIRLTQHAKEVGADGTLQITPYYNKPTQDGLLAHFEAIHEAVDLPIVLYNVPGRTSVNLLPETVTQLAKFKNIIGIKEASGSLEQVSQIIEGCSSDFIVLSGEDSLTFPMLSLGVKGAISVTANLVPKLCAEMFHCLGISRHGTQMTKNPNWEKAREIHFKLSEINRTLFIATNPIPIKSALAMTGKIKDELRLPLTSLKGEKRQALENALVNLQLI
ncbi:MAG: 4-hydroxy-tetrahydrodipicolinate synthase [Deltaproteobacteria bacterium]|nr:4-hydroxy-tetrahydrodipicolinate synthase [Deltaproteobacteria bacterium]